MTSESPPGPRSDHRLRASVVIMAYDRREFVLAALASATAQEFARDRYEIVVVKNFNDLAIDAAIASAGARAILDDSPEVGSTVARGLVEARGDVVCFLDDDDEMEPSKLSNVVPRFDADPELVLVRNGYRSIDVRGKALPGWPVCEWPADGFRHAVTLRTPAEKEASRVLPMYNLSTISVRRSALAPFVPRFRGVVAGSDSLVFLAALSTPGHLHVDPGLWNRHRVHESASRESFGEGGVSPPQSPDYLARSLTGLRQQGVMVRGTVAEPWARWLYLITRFDAYLGRPEFPPPSVEEFQGFARGAVRERQPFRLWALGFAAAGRVAPRWSRRRWWTFRQQRHRSHTPGVDYTTVFPTPGEQR